MSRPVLFDVDPGCDDAAMLALALASDELDVVGVTTVAGNARLEDTTRNALAVLELMGRTDVPVVPGCDRPLVEPPETAESVHGAGGLPGERADPDVVPAADDAVSFLRAQSRQVEDLAVVATGPLTNVAAAFAIDPGVTERVAGIHVMGGAVRVGGNASAAAEYNFHADPEAAARVVRDGAPRIVGLDVTKRATLAPAKLEALVGAGEPVRTIAGWLAYGTPETVAREGIGASRPLHDPAVVVDLLSGVLSYEVATLEVDHGTGVSRGALLRDEREAAADPNAEVAVDIDVGAFRATALDLLDRLGT
jgi:purine nucleosidase